MRASDPRHGTRAGYVAGCRQDCCREPHLRYQKRSTLRRLREGSQYVDGAPVLRRLDQWGRYGVTPRAVGMAANLSESTLRELVSGATSRVEKGTARAVLAVTWDDLPDSALVNAEVTRWRLYSLMAAGHPLHWIARQVHRVNEGGKWRTQKKVTLGLARDVMALFDAAPIVGPSRQSATKAAKLGYVTRGRWDNPRVPAMPDDWQPTLERHRAKTDVDEAVVLRVMAGERLPMTTGERVEVVARLRARGWSLNEITMHTGIGKAERYAAKGDAA